MDAAAPPPVVSLWGTFGAGETEIGRLVAERLGVQCITEDAVATDGDGRLTRAVRSFAAYADESADPGWALGIDATRDHVRSLHNTAEVQRFAEQGAVICGHHAAVILAGRPHTLTVKLDGPVFARIASVAADTGQDESQTARQQRTEDSARAQASRTLHNYDPTDIDSFDLVLNTTLLNPDVCADIIVAALERKTRG